MGLPFLLPNEACSRDYHSCAWNESCTVENLLVKFCAGCVGRCFLSADWSDKECLLISHEVKGVQEPSDCSSSWIFLVRNPKAQIGGQCKPSQQVGQRPGFPCAEDSRNCQCRPAGL